MLHMFINSPKDGGNPSPRCQCLQDVLHTTMPPTPSKGVERAPFGGVGGWNHAMLTRTLILSNIDTLLFPILPVDKLNLS